MNNLSEQVGVYRRSNSNKMKMIKLEKHPFIPIGTLIGWWTVIETGLYMSSGSREARACRVRCRCGTEKTLSCSHLRSKNCCSCGCKSKERSVESVWNSYHSSYKRRGWDFHFTVSQLKAVSQLPCAYCGKEPSNVFRARYTDGDGYRREVDPTMEVRYSGLDRVDSSKGYVVGNVVPCCGQCNTMKSKLPLDDFLALIERIHSHNSTTGKIRELAATLF